MNNIYLINKIASDTSSSEIYPVRTFKGDVNLQLDFSNVVETEVKLIKIEIIFDRDTVIEKTYNRKTSLFDTVTHLYSPSEHEYLISKRCIVNLTFCNFTIHSIIIPINIAQPSFLSEYGSLRVKNAQFIDGANTGDMLLILESEKYNLYNVCMKARRFSTIEDLPPAVDNILITDDEEPFITNFEDNIKV